MKRRKLLSMGGAGAVLGLSGCIDEIRGINSDENGDEEADDTAETDDEKADDTTESDNTTDENPRSREAICPEPPTDLTEVDYEKWTTGSYTTGTSSPLLEDGYFALRDNEKLPRDSSKANEKRLSMVTEETKDRLNPERLDGDLIPGGPEDTAEPTFIEETDFETSVLVAFEWEWSGFEELVIEAVDLEGAETVHFYACRVGDPWEGGGHGEPSAGSAITFFRLEMIPTTVKFTYSYRDFRDPKETDTYLAEL